MLLSEDAEEFKLMHAQMHAQMHAPMGGEARFGDTSSSERNQHTNDTLPTVVSQLHA